MAMKAGSISALSLIPAQTDRPMSQSEEVPSARIVDMSLMQRLTLRDSGGEGRVSADDESTERREGLKRLDYRHLQVFEAVYVARNITRAGRSLGVSQPKMSTLLARLRDVLENSVTQPVDWAALSADTTVEELGFDSLSILDVLYGIEQEFGIELDAGDVMDLKTVGDLMDVMAAKAA